MKQNVPTPIVIAVILVAVVAISGIYSWYTRVPPYSVEEGKRVMQIMKKSPRGISPGAPTRAAAPIASKKTL